MKPAPKRIEYIEMNLNWKKSSMIHQPMRSLRLASASVGPPNPSIMGIAKSGMLTMKMPKSATPRMTSSTIRRLEARVGSESERISEGAASDVRGGGSAQFGSIGGSIGVVMHTPHWTGRVSNQDRDRDRDRDRDWNVIRSDRVPLAS